MNRLTPQERRKVYEAQQRAREIMLARLNAPVTSPAGPVIDEIGRRRLLKAAVIAAVLGGGFLASTTLEFHLPASLIEALLPRL
ncbi:MAG: hypothetical protein ACREJ9_07060 [Candidatus Rokuibacteriota bacterium]